MAMHLKDHRCVQTHGLRMIPSAVGQSHLQGPLSVLKRRPYHHHGPQHQPYQPYLTPLMIHSNRNDLLNHFSMAPLMCSGTVDDRSASIESMSRSSHTSIPNTFDNEWRVSSSDRMFPRYMADTGFEMPVMPTIGSQCDQQSLTAAMFGQDASSALGSSLTSHVMVDPPTGQQAKHIGSPALPWGFALLDDDEMRSSYEPSLSISPQDVFLDPSAHLFHQSSPTPSIHDDGYGSATDSYRSESPMSQSLDDYDLSDDRPFAVPATSFSQRGTRFPSKSHITAVSASALSEKVDGHRAIPRSEPLFDDLFDDSGYAGTDSGDDMRSNGPSAREAQNHFLVQARRAGKTYKEIRAAGNFREAESTLRGRYRDLTKRKHERVRKPVWTRRDVKLLTEIVDDLLDASPFPDHLRRNHPASLKAALPRVPWKKVSAYIADNGGSYRFASATCKKQYMQITGLN